MEDQPTKAQKEKKKSKTDKKKAKAEEVIAQSDEPVETYADDAAAAVAAAAEPRAHDAATVVAAGAEPRAHDAATVVVAAGAEPRAHDDAGAAVSPESVREEMKKFKEQLLQSVAEIECPGGRSAGADGEAPSETLLRIRERSMSRPYELPSPASPDTAPDASAEHLLLEMDDGKLAELKEAFLLFDLDGDGCISHTDLRGTLVSLGQQVDDNEVRKMISEAASPLDFDSFVTLLGYRTVELDPEETLIDALAQWDYAGTGLISEDRIRHDLVTWGDRFSEREAAWALEEAPTVQRRGDTMIDYITFCKTLCGLRKANKKFNQ